MRAKRCAQKYRGVAGDLGEAADDNNVNGSLSRIPATHPDTLCAPLCPHEMLPRSFTLARAGAGFTDTPSNLNEGEWKIRPRSVFSSDEGVVR